MSPLNLHHLRLFRAVAADGTLTGAARGLNLSQSALSTQLRALEATLGQDLFERRGRGLVLTEAGRIALDHAEVIFRTAEDLTATLRDAGRARRALRVGALATLSRNFQMQFLRPLIGRADVEVVLRSGAQDDLLRGGVIERLMCDLSVDAAKIAEAHGFDPAMFDEVPQKLEAALAAGIATIEGTRVFVPSQHRLFLRTVAAAFDTHFVAAPNRHAKAV